MRDFREKEAVMRDQESPFPDSSLSGKRVMKTCRHALLVVQGGVLLFCLVARKKDLIASMEVGMKSDGDRTFSLPSPHATLTGGKPDILGKNIILAPHPTPPSTTLSNKPGALCAGRGIV